MELAHDFRSPLTTILFLTETIRSGQSGDISQLQKDQLGIVYRAAISLISMADDVIELARGERNHSARAGTSFSLRELLASVCDIVRPMADTRGLSLRTSSPAGDRYVGHPISLKRVLLNLTTNAVQATREGVVEIAAREVSHSRIGFSVRDTGSGLDTEMREHLLEPFWTKNTDATDEFSGTGLGLTISRKLVAAMGGELRFETQAEGGTRFTFELALSPGDTPYDPDR